MKDARFILQGTERPTIPASEIFLDKVITVKEVEYPRGASLETLIAAVDTRPYKTYVAKMSQSGTNAPTVTVYENTLGGELVWTRSSAGVYVATLEGAFSSGNVLVNNTLSLAGGTTGTIKFASTDANTITINNYFGGPPSNQDGFTNIILEIRIYN